MNHRITNRQITATVTLLAVLAAAGCSAGSNTEQAAGLDGFTVEASDLPGVVTTHEGATAPSPTPPDTAAGSSDGELDGELDGETGATGVTTGQLTGDELEDANDLLDDSDDQPAPEPGEQPAAPPAAGDEGDAPVDLPSDGQSQPTSSACDELPDDGSSLVVGPDPLVLDQGDLTGSLFIVNCGDTDIDWTAKTKPSVSLDDDSANLLAGGFAKLDFTIDADAWEPGAVGFKIKVSETGFNHYVDIHAFRQLVGKDIVAGGGNLTAGPGAGGCANQCITSALLQPNFTSPDLGLDITTNTPARIRTWVSTQAPVITDDVPSFPGVGPIDGSPLGVTEHRAMLSPLSAGTDYHIIVSATDEYNHTSYRIGEFTTITPVENPSDFKIPGDPPGCSADCITKAQITSGADFSVKHLSIASHTAAQFQVFVSTQAPTWSNGVPSFADTDVWQPSGLEFVTNWATDLEGLDASTNYHIIVRATDAYGHVDYRTGQFTTAAAPTYDVVFTNLGVDVQYDGDKGANRGELNLGWRVGDDHVANTGEHKVSSGDWVNFKRPDSTYVAYGITDWLPTVIVAGTERDPDAKTEFCSMGTGTPMEDGSNSKCDVVWSTTGSGLIRLDSLSGYPTCVSLGFDEVYGDQRCLTLATGDKNGGRPEFTAYIAVEVNG